MSNRKSVLELDMQRNVVAGSPEALRQAISRGADLRIYTEFRHNEHIDITSNNPEMIKEVSDFPGTYLVENRWVAANMTLRQPVTLPDRFGDRASMSFFMYNEDGRQGAARPFLEEAPPPNPNAPKVSGPGCDITKWHDIAPGNFDAGTNAPAINFIYDFYSYKFLVQDDWTEVLSHDAEGNVISGDPRELERASEAGCDLKVGIRGICEGLWDMHHLPDHELFIQTGPHYFYTETGYMVAETRPFVRVEPAIPMAYKSHNWDFGWAIVRSDGHVAGLWYDPYTLKPSRTYGRYAMRWFARY